MWRYPFGSGGKRVCTRPLYLFVLRSSMKRSRMKLEGRDSGAGLVPVSCSAAGVVIILDLTAVERRTPSSAGAVGLIFGKIRGAERQRRPGLHAQFRSPSLPLGCDGTRPLLPNSTRPRRL